MKNFVEFSVESLIIQWRAVRQSIRECLRLTPDDLLTWAPKDGMFALGLIYVHISTAIDWWLTTIIKDGGKWTPMRQLPINDRQKLDDHLVGSLARLERFAREADLTRMYEFKGEQVSGYWAVLHLFEHDIHHRAQVKTYLRLNGIDPPDD
jgi:uncharacterized damage-inducible protein DinB